MAQESLNSITSVLAEKLDKSLDAPFKRMLAVRVDAWRSTLLQRSLEKHPEQRRLYRQTLWVPMQTVTEVPCAIPVPLCPVSESIKVIPVPLRGTVLFSYVGGIDGKSPFGYATAGTEGFLSAGKYSKNGIWYEYVNGRIRIGSKTNLPMIRIDEVFDNPSDVFEFNCESGDCDGWDKPYPVTGDILQMIFQYVLQELAPIKDAPTEEITIS